MAVDWHLANRYSYSGGIRLLPYQMYATLWFLAHYTAKYSGANSAGLAFYTTIELAEPASPS
jgi:hypothetical protein